MIDIILLGNFTAFIGNYSCLTYKVAKTLIIKAVFEYILIIDRFKRNKNMNKQNKTSSNVLPNNGRFYKKKISIIDTSKDLVHNFVCL